MAQNLIKEYVVACKRGRITVEVRQHYIDTYGERQAVATAAWNKLMCLPETKEVLETELGSRIEGHRQFVYYQFEEAISFTLMRFRHG